MIADGLVGVDLEEGFDILTSDMISLMVLPGEIEGRWREIRGVYMPIFPANLFGPSA
jgi:hypothetical protein